MIRTWTTVVALALVIGGAAARFAARNQTFFGDEIWVLEFVGNGRYTPHAVPQPPLYFFSAVAASRLCGMSEGCLRAPAAVLTYEMRDGWMRLARYDRRSGSSP